ncbi:hypothetical protein SAMN02745181_3451 [Rubritalea squalenifaciens DSM 18772]|uniref:Uncharacterized protein n=1 Tax=Rubritalea squalenifaciens DSM 18772 TaxID=1123071 RepID=A0A1M6QNL3_9BACT|nr:hypothetical protein [Rubritalea squalenifaciens]SHK21680.1 hypothetical protein SAMN02745181_3451 [Rubritalea squalenifaciens DSM 18772]
MKSLLLPLLALLCALPLSASEDSRPAFADVLARRVESTVIPKVDFRNITMDQALDYLRQRSAEIQREGRAVPSRIPQPTPGKEGEPEGIGPGAKRLTFQASDITTGDALRACCRLTGNDAYVTSVGTLIVKKGHKPFASPDENRTLIWYSVHRQHTSLTKLQDSASEQILARLEDTILTEVAINNQSLATALKTINSRSSPTATSPTIIDIKLQSGSTQSSTGSSTSTQNPPTVTLNARTIPFAQAVDFLCTQAGYTWTLSTQGGDLALIIKPH